jgi:hypothetical protein
MLAIGSTKFKPLAYLTARWTGPIFYGLLSTGICHEVSTWIPGPICTTRGAILHSFRSPRFQGLA